jgi:hypothetical protein
MRHWHSSLGPPISATATSRVFALIDLISSSTFIVSRPDQPPFGVPAVFDPALWLMKYSTGQLGRKCFAVRQSGSAEDSMTCRAFE